MTDRVIFLIKALLTDYANKNVKIPEPRDIPLLKRCELTLFQTQARHIVNTGLKFGLDSGLSPKFVSPLMFPLFFETFKINLSFTIVKMLKNEGYPMSSPKSNHVFKLCQCHSIRNQTVGPLGNAMSP